jgi:molybdopterin molybdotransferase
MTTFEEAYNIVIESAKSVGTEHCCIEESLGRILATDVVSDMDMPPFNRSAMDGYACKREDLQNELEVLETVAAGESPTKTVGKNQCTKIMTGAAVPEGADVVIMVEQTEIISANKIRFTGKDTAPNISRKAEDVCKGEVVLKKGQLLNPQQIAILAAVGCNEPLVSKKVKVGIISTGDELVEPDQVPGPSQIRNSNAYQLISQVQRVNANPVYYGIAKDNPEITETIINKALSECDIVLLTGGVSMGDFDFVPAILKKNNIRLLFEKLDVKPGRPTVFGTNGKNYVFGLPGNPVSSFIMFEMLVRLLIYEIMGYRYQPKSVFMQLDENFLRKKADRLMFVPVVFSEEGKLKFVKYHGSAHLHSMSNADGIILVPLNTTEIKRGELVHVRQI